MTTGAACVERRKAGMNGACAPAMRAGCRAPTGSTAVVGVEVEAVVRAGVARPLVGE
jgi:hypothetical protein